MHRSSIAAAAFASVLLSGAVQATEAFVPEVLTVEERIKPGPNLFVLDQSWDGSSQTVVLSRDDLSIKGNLSFGIVGQMAVNSDFTRLYSLSHYAKRIMSGPTESVLEEYDIPTLTTLREVIVPNKAAQVAPSNAILAISHDDNYAYVQNATPATSVTVVDLKDGSVLQEVPTPGCYGIYPAMDSVKFTTVCGDGRFQSFSLGSNGQFGSPESSETIFDPDQDPIFIVGKRAGENLLFISFSGDLYQVSDSDKAPRLVSKKTVASMGDGAWAPGGVDVIAYNEANDLVFVTMHSEPYDGSHKNGADEVWAVDLKSGEVHGRTAVKHLVSLSVTDGEQPVLFGLDEDGMLYRYEVQVDADFALEETNSVEGVGGWAIFSLTES
ncbi:amine dehydrogenase large subunit [Marinobacter sp.]|uniref:amine dehydrogenase large subunit n=1 Tax=Marinobacter sp. TaxID=50741 RepID=UPI00356720CC